MTAKEKLMQVQKYEERIEELEMVIEQLKESIKSISGIRYDKEQVQTSPEGDAILSALIRIEEREKKLESLKNEALNYTVDVISNLARMDDPTGVLKKLLLKKYIQWKEFPRLKDVGADMGYSYDYIIELHGKALSAYSHVNPFEPI